jgi:hypothetical protein
MNPHDLPKKAKLSHFRYSILLSIVLNLSGKRGLILGENVNELFVRASDIVELIGVSFLTAVAGV